MVPITLALASIFACAPMPMQGSEWKLPQMVDSNGFHSRPVPESLRNAWPHDLEKEFQQRAQSIVKAQTDDQPLKVNTYFENEKRTYGFLMAHVLGGDTEKAIKLLQSQDHQHEQWHRETDGIDYYACFTLKHQMRKYFYFGELLDPEYQRQMFSGAKKWTAKDPMRRPHYAYTTPKEGWGPDARNSWVDIRSTENLFLMRVTSVYLMAEETGNIDVASVYKKHILNYTSTLYRVGIGEWDSENYHGHSIAPLLNLHDFAKDIEVKSAAKACLDFYAAAGAVKYYRGGFNGPTKRDYNHPQPFGGSAANSLWVWFGDHPSGKTSDWESDEVHQITSAYRPPLAVVNLARKKFDRPIEVFSAKPKYDATTSYQSNSAPAYAETQYIANSFQLGTLTNGTSIDGGDVNGFKILAYDERDGAIALHAIPGSNPLFPGSPMYKQGIVAGENRIAQQENIAIWLVKNGAAPWTWVIPPKVKVSEVDGITVLQCNQTWVGIRPLGTTQFTCTSLIPEDSKSPFSGYQVLSASGSSKKFCGFAVEVGERQSHGSLAEFRKAVLAAEVDTSQLDDGIARYKSKKGQWLGIHWNDDPLKLGVWRNGKRRDLQSLDLYNSSVIKSAWGSGIIEINAGGEFFRCEVDPVGRVKTQN